MCGITGFLSKQAYSKNKLSEIINKMTATLVHRGPDDGDTWWNVKDSIGLGHRRLAILDLSPLGRQPMTSQNGRYTVVYNGEIYNYQEIRTDLEKRGYKFSTNCDTEVLLEAFSEWGLDSLKRFIGMFAFGLWDSKDKKLYLARDRLGIKPLYYGWSSQDHAFLFGSELKALCAYPGFKNPIDLEALGIFFRHNYIPAPFSIYQNIHKVIPGQVIILGKQDLDQKKVSKKIYWSALDAWQKGLNAPLTGSAEENLDLFENTLLDAIRLRLITDVPLGAFLSGGIDSSTVVALMQSVNNRAVRTFSVGFKEAEYNEAPFARQVANHLGTDHTELYVTAQDALDLVPRLPGIWDEPFADSSQIPTLLISKLTRDFVTVALSGDGGDELFWGYPRYEKTLEIWNLLKKFPSCLKSAAFLALNILPNTLLDPIGDLFHPIFAKYGLKGPLSRASKRIQELLNTYDFALFYGWANSHFQPFGPICKGQDRVAPVFEKIEHNNVPQRELMSILDILTYLPDDILTKVDRASMAVALEARVPILDHRVVELSFRLPASLKFRNGQGKWILRQILYKYVPRELVDRPKKGFGIPLDQWLRGPLKEWASELLRPDRLRREGYLFPEKVDRLWQEHISGKCNHQYILWNILMFQAWLEKWGK